MPVGVISVLQLSHLSGCADHFAVLGFDILRHICFNPFDSISGIDSINSWRIYSNNWGQCSDCTMRGAAAAAQSQQHPGHHDNDGEKFLAKQLNWIHGAAKKECPLPPSACWWQQGSIIKGIPTGQSKPNCKFLVRDPEFLEILGPAPELKLVAETDAHEGGVYHPDNNEFYYSTTRHKVGYTSMITSSDEKDSAGEQNTQVRKISLDTGEITTVFPVTDVANGMVLDREGNLLICQQGQGKKPGYIQRVDVKTLETSIVADNWFGAAFNSPNDVVVKSDGTIWFTDPIYAWAQGFKPEIQVEGQLYRINLDGVVDAMATNFQRPNGLAFSPDEKLLYVTDTGYLQGEEFDKGKRHHIYVYKVREDGMLSSRRLLASVGMYDGSAPGLGLPDGIKVDTKGRIYIGSPDGVQVFSRSGKPLGLIALPDVVNLGFAGEKLNKLYILNDSSIHMIELQATGAGLHYASKFMKK